MSLPVAPAAGFDVEAPLLVVGGGACGLVAALAAHDAGAEVLVLERDAVCAGSTALSCGLIPAAGSRWQRDKGVEDSPALFAADIQRKAHNEAAPELVKLVTEQAAPTLEWLADKHGIEFLLIEGFLYPGHNTLRMHAVPERTGAGLMARLLTAVERAGIDLVNSAPASNLYRDPAAPERVAGVRLEHPNGDHEDLGCRALLLAGNGFGGNRAMLKKYIPEMAEAEYAGHTGNQGDAVSWGLELGAALRHMGAYQGHGSVATPHGILITWALMMEGGIQVNTNGQRFSNEHQGYSEQAVAVLAQQGGVAWNIYDARLHTLGCEFDNYRRADAAGALRQGAGLAELAAATGLPLPALEETMKRVRACADGQAVDVFDRNFTKAPPLEPPFYAVKVTGNLFHTQGGLVVNRQARVLRPDGSPLPNLFAGGGAACGVSGSSVHGYLSGNGLLTAITLGHIAGMAAGSDLA